MVRTPLPVGLGSRFTQRKKQSTQWIGMGIRLRPGPLVGTPLQENSKSSLTEVIWDAWSCGSNLRGVQDEWPTPTKPRIWQAYGTPQLIDWLTD